MSQVLAAGTRREQAEELYRQLYERRKEVYKEAKDRWPELLRDAGVPAEFLRLRKPGPCPFCQTGKDRYTFTDRDGDGDFCCRGCSGGSGEAFGGKGVTFLMKFNGWSWTEAVDWVLNRLGDPTLPRLEERVIELRAQSRGNRNSPEEEARRRAKFKEVWTQARKVTPGDPVHTYLTTRVPGLESIPRAIRFHPELEYFEQAKDGGRPRSRGKFPAMVCAVVDADGRCCNVHRTYLTPEGSKAVITDEDGVLLDIRKQMPAVPCVSPAIRLTEGQHNQLGVAEGVETALAAAVFAKIPTWSVISTSGMRGFLVPDWVSILTIFADNDRPDQKGRRPGFEAAHALAKRDDVVQRVANRTLRVMVRTPSREGMDIADLLLGLRHKIAA